MVSQNAIASKQHPGGYLPYAFTEHGVLMLANVLKSERAIAVSLSLIEIFVKMRVMLSTHKDILVKLEQLEKKAVAQDTTIKTIFGAIKQILKQPPVNPQQPGKRIGFRRQGEAD